MKDASSNSYSLRTITRHKPVIRVIAFITLVAFLATTIPADFAWAAAASEKPVSAASNKKEFNPKTFVLPQYLGRIKDSWSPETLNPKTENRTVIHIQDAHCNYDCQKRIAEIAQYLTREFGVSVINLEGGAGDYDLSVFKNISNGAVREKASDILVKNGLVNGAEYFAANNPDKVSLWGIEDAGLYLENLNIYRNSIKYKDEIDSNLKALSRELASLKIRIYSKDLLEFDTKYAQYKNNNIEFKAYITYLLGVARSKSVDINKFSSLNLLSQSLEKEAGIDFKKANTERDQLTDRLQKIFSKLEVEELVVKTLEFKTNKITQTDYYAYLFAKAKEVGINTGYFPELVKYTAYVGQYNAIDSVKVIAEVDKLESILKNLLCESDVQRELILLSKNLSLLKNIFNISITRDDYKYYKANEASFGVKRFIAFIKKQGTVQQPIDGAEDLDTYRGEMARFYEWSLKRDEAFIKNMRFSGKSQVAIVVTGGFHTENLCELFRKNNISYVSVMPNFRNCDGYENPYFKLLSGNPYAEFVKATQSLGLSAIPIASNLNSLGKQVAGLAVQSQVDHATDVLGRPTVALQATPSKANSASERVRVSRNAPLPIPGAGTAEQLKTWSKPEEFEENMDFYRWIFQNSIKDFRKSVRGKNVLDIGTGLGQIAIWAKENNAEDVIGIDLNTESLNIAKRLAKERGANVRFEMGDTSHLRFVDGQFDVVTAGRVFGFLSASARRKALEEISRVTREGGLILLIEYHDGVYEREWRGGGVYSQPRKTSDYTQTWRDGYWTEDKWKEELERVGFIDVGLSWVWEFEVESNVKLICARKASKLSAPAHEIQKAAAIAEVNKNAEKPAGPSEARSESISRLPSSLKWLGIISLSWVEEMAHLFIAFRSKGFAEIWKQRSSVFWKGKVDLSRAPPERQRQSMCFGLIASLVAICGLDVIACLTGGGLHLTPDDIALLTAASFTMLRTIADLALVSSVPDHELRKAFEWGGTGSPASFASTSQGSEEGARTTGILANGRPEDRITDIMLALRHKIEELVSGEEREAVYRWLNNDMNRLLNISGIVREYVEEHTRHNASEEVYKSFVEGTARRIVKTAREGGPRIVYAKKTPEAGLIRQYMAATVEGLPFHLTANEAARLGVTMTEEPEDRHHAPANVRVFGLECADSARTEIFLRWAIAEDLKIVDRWLRMNGLYLYIVSGWRSLEEQQQAKDRYMEEKGQKIDPDISEEERTKEVAEIREFANSLFSDANPTAPHCSGGAFDIEIRSMITGRRMPTKPWDWSPERFKDKEKKINQIPEADRLWYQLAADKLRGYKPLEDAISDPKNGRAPDWFMTLLKNRRLLFSLLTRNANAGGILPNGHSFVAHKGEFWHFGRGDRTSALFSGRKAYYDLIERIGPPASPHDDPDDVDRVLSGFIASLGQGERVFYDFGSPSPFSSVPAYDDADCKAWRSGYREFLIKLKELTDSVPVEAGGSLPKLVYIIKELMKNEYDGIVSFYDTGVSPGGVPAGFRGIITLSMTIAQENGKKKLVIKVAGNGMGIKAAGNARKKQLKNLYIYTSQGEGVGLKYAKYFCNLMDGRLNINIASMSGDRSTATVEIPLTSLRIKSPAKTSGQAVSTEADAGNIARDGAAKKGFHASVTKDVAGIGWVVKTFDNPDPAVNIRAKEAYQEAKKRGFIADRLTPNFNIYEHVGKNDATMVRQRSAVDLEEIMINFIIGRDDEGVEKMTRFIVLLYMEILEKGAFIEDYKTSPLLRNFGLEGDSIVMLDIANLKFEDMSLSSHPISEARRQELISEFETHLQGEIKQLRAAVASSKPAAKKDIGTGVTRLLKILTPFMDHGWRKGIRALFLAPPLEESFYRWLLPSLTAGLFGSPVASHLVWGTIFIALHYDSERRWLPGPLLLTLACWFFLPVSLADPLLYVGLTTAFHFATNLITMLANENLPRDRRYGYATIGANGPLGELISRIAALFGLDKIQVRLLMMGIQNPKNPKDKVIKLCAELSDVVRKNRKIVLAGTQMEELVDIIYKLDLREAADIRIGETIADILSEIVSREPDFFDALVYRKAKSKTYFALKCFSIAILKILLKNKNIPLTIDRIDSARRSAGLIVHEAEVSERFWQAGYDQWQSALPANKGDFGLWIYADDAKWEARIIEEHHMTPGKITGNLMMTEDGKLKIDIVNAPLDQTPWKAEAMYISRMGSDIVTTQFDAGKSLEEMLLHIDKALALTEGGEKIDSMTPGNSIINELLMGKSANDEVGKYNNGKRFVQLDAQKQRLYLYILKTVIERLDKTYDIIDLSRRLEQAIKQAKANVAEEVRPDEKMDEPGDKDETPTNAGVQSPGAPDTNDPALRAVNLNGAVLLSESLSSLAHIVRHMDGPVLILIDSPVPHVGKSTTAEAIAKGKYDFNPAEIVSIKGDVFSDIMDEVKDGTDNKEITYSLQYELIRKDEEIIRSGRINGEYLHFSRYMGHYFNEHLDELIKNGRVIVYEQVGAIVSFKVALHDYPQLKEKLNIVYAIILKDEEGNLFLRTDILPRKDFNQAAVSSGEETVTTASEEPLQETVSEAAQKPPAADAAPAPVSEPIAEFIAASTKTGAGAPVSAESTRAAAAVPQLITKYSPETLDSASALLEAVREPSSPRVFFIPVKDYDINAGAYAAIRKYTKDALEANGFSPKIFFYDGTEDGLRQAYIRAKQEMEGPACLALVYAGKGQYDMVKGANGVFGKDSRVQCVQEDISEGFMDVYMHVVIGLGFLDFVKYGTFNGRFKSMFENMAVLDGAALADWNNDPAKFITDLLGGKHTLATRVNFKALEDMDRGHKLVAQAA